MDRASGEVEDRIFKDIIDYFDEKDLFIFNDTKVFSPRVCTATRRRPAPRSRSSCCAS